MRRLSRKFIRNRAEVAARITPPVPNVRVGKIRDVLSLCKQHIAYGDNEAIKAVRERADAADFYRRAAELAMAELNSIISTNN